MLQPMILLKDMKSVHDDDDDYDDDDDDDDLKHKHRVLMSLMISLCVMDRWTISHRSASVHTKEMICSLICCLLWCEVSINFRFKQIVEF